MEIDITIAGIKYNIDIEVDENYVCGVNYVGVYTTEGLMDLGLDTEDCDKFFERYEDEINEMYQNTLIAAAECAAEERWERQEDR